MDNVDVKALQTRATMPLVFTESLSYYQCIYMLYTKINEMIDVLNKCEEFVDSMVNYLQINYELADTYRDTINSSKTAAIIRGSMNGFLQLVSAFNFVNSSTERNVTVYMPTNYNSNTIHWPADYSARVYFMNNDTLCEETITQEAGSALIATTGNLVVVTMSSSGGTPVAEISPEIFDVTNATEIRPTGMGWNEVKIQPTDGSANVYLNYGSQTIRVSVVDGAAVYPVSTTQWLPEIYTGNHPEIKTVIQPNGDPLLKIPDYMYMQLSGDEAPGDITYYTYTGLVTKRGENGVTVDYPKTVLTYYDNLNKIFRVKRYTGKYTTGRSKAREIDE